MTRVNAALLLPLLAALAGGCAPAQSNDHVSIEEALDSSDHTSTESALAMAASSGMDVTWSGPVAAVAAVAKAKLTFSPATCVDASAAGSVVTYHFNNCNGPHGISHLSGDVQVTFTSMPGGFTLDVAAKGLTCNGSTLTLGCHAVLSDSPQGKKLTVMTAGLGVGPRGNQVSRQGNYVVTWDPSTYCSTLEGAWATTVNGASASTTMRGYAQCGIQCPTAGVLTHTHTNGVVYTLGFDGTDRAKWTTSTGKSGAFDLLCLP